MKARAGRLIWVLLAVIFTAWPAASFAIEPALDARNYPSPEWSPYIVGTCIGILSWLTFYFSDKPIGASSFYAAVAGLIGKAIAPLHTGKLAYFKENPPAISWEFAFVLFAIAGAAVAAATGNGLMNEWVPQMWTARFGESVALRAVIAFAGGCLMAFGARLAGGCTSGHGISGTLQLNVASWIAVICFFIGGAVIANLMFRL